MNLSKECLEAIEKSYKPLAHNTNSSLYTLGMKEALLNPEIYTKAGLIKPLKFGGNKQGLLESLQAKYGDKYTIVEANPDPTKELLDVIGLCWKAVDLSKLTDEEIEKIHQVVKLTSI